MLPQQAREVFPQGQPGGIHTRVGAGTSRLLQPAASTVLILQAWRANGPRVEEAQQ